MELNLTEEEKTKIEEKEKFRMELIETLDNTIHTFLNLPEIKKCRKEIE